MQISRGYFKVSAVLMVGAILLFAASNLFLTITPSSEEVRTADRTIKTVALTGQVHVIEVGGMDVVIRKETGNVIRVNYIAGPSLLIDVSHNGKMSRVTETNNRFRVHGKGDPAALGELHLIFSDAKGRRFNRCSIYTFSEIEVAAGMLTRCSK